MTRKSFASRALNLVLVCAFRGWILASRIAKRKTLSIVSVGLTSLVIGAAFSLLVHMPQPAVHDEFSYLLAADTFSHGRLSNPTPPLWVHFESFHIIQQPTYASKYPPGQGVMLALGQIIAGRPIVGAWLSTALACAALCWMLMAWVPPRWALVGGLLAAVHPTIIQWSQTYWGGSVAMCGGALILGSFRRLWQEPRMRDGCVFGLGLLVLANSRPYEGGVLVLILSAIFVVGICTGRSPPIADLLTRAAPPIAIALAATAAGVGFYNIRVTGSILRMPYSVHEETYGAARLFLWQSPKPEPIYRHKEIRDFQVGRVLPDYTSQRSLSGAVLKDLKKLWTLAKSTFRLWTLAVALLAIPWSFRNDWWTRLALLMCGLFTGALLLETWVQTHYAAPIIGLGFVVLLRAMRYLNLWRWRGRPLGRLLVRASLLLSVFSLVGACITLPRLPKGKNAWSERRARILVNLQSGPERHLIIVQYMPDHSPFKEWVYNDADIDSAKVVWARKMAASQNRELRQYFKDRRVWLLDGDAKVPELVPYAGQPGY